MENAIKALYMGAGLLIGVMVLGVLVYVFRSGARVSESYEIKKGTEQVQAFNAQFEVYDQRTEQSSNTSDGYSFKSKGNTASDVVSCANLAMDTNSRYDFDLQNTVQVTIDMGTYNYYIYPLRKLQKKNYFIKDIHFDSARGTEEAGGELNGDKYINFNDFLKEYNDVRIVDIVSTNYKSSSETIYQYYFDVLFDDTNEGITYSEVTGKVNSITFKLNETEHYGEPNGAPDTEYWK